MNPGLAILGKYYKCWRDDEFIGIAIFEDDSNIGPAFISMAVDVDGDPLNEVFIPDFIEEIPA